MNSKQKFKVGDLVKSNGFYGCVISSDDHYFVAQFIGVPSEHQPPDGDGKYWFRHSNPGAIEIEIKAKQ
jgi:hypothetical protein